MSDPAHDEWSVDDLERIRAILSECSSLNFPAESVEDVRSVISVGPNAAHNFTLEQMAAITGLSVLTLRQYVREGRILTHRRWRNHLVTGNEVARFLYRQDTGSDLPAHLAVGVLLVGERNPRTGEYETIEQYRFFNILDIKSWRVEASQRYIDRLLKGASIELIPWFDDFFELSGLLTSRVWSEEPDADVTNPRLSYAQREVIRSAAPNHAGETRAQVINRLREVFGDASSQDVLLMLWNELTRSLNECDVIAKQNESLLAQNQAMRDKIIRLEQQLGNPPRPPRD